MGKKLNVKAETKLEKVALRWLNRKGHDYDNGAADALKDLLYGGCSSGIVGELIYTADTVKFFTKHKQDISNLLYDCMESSGCDVSELLKDWDRQDPLAMQDANQNLLAWFGFEEAARRLGERAGLEI
jgi:hypothetical protein